MGGFIGAALAQAGGSLISDLAVSALNYAGQRNLQEDSQSWQRHVLQNQKQWQVQDLRAAGLNPILATGINPAMPGSTSSGFSGASNSAMREYLASQRRKETAVADEQIATAQSAQKLNDAQAKTAKTVQDVNSAQAEKIRAEAEKVRRETTQIPTLTQEEIASIEHRKHSTYFGALVNDIGGLISRLGTSEMSRVEKQAEALLRRQFEASGLPAFQQPSDFEIQQMAKKIAEQKAKKTTDKGGIKHPTGRSVLY